MYSTEIGFIIVPLRHSSASKQWTRGRQSRSKWWLAQTNRKNNLRSHYPTGREVPGCCDGFFLIWVELHFIVQRLICRLAAKLSWLAWLCWFCLMKSWRLRHTLPNKQLSNNHSNQCESWFLILCELIPRLLGNTACWTLEVTQTDFND